MHTLANVEDTVELVKAGQVMCLWAVVVGCEAEWTMTCCVAWG